MEVEAGCMIMPAANEVLGKLNLISKSELDESDVVEKCPNSRYIRI